jgi:hypothetical protein
LVFDAHPHPNLPPSRGKEPVILSDREGSAVRF